MTQNFDVFAKRKGQSAIEYLMTYGWMLLVVAIVGGAIFATVQGQCTQSTSGFSTTDVRVADFAQTSDGDMAFELRNAAADPVEVTNISVNGEGTIGSNQINVGSTETFTVSGLDVSSVDGCNDHDLTIQYDVVDGIQDQEVSGSLTAPLDISAP